MMVIRRQSRSGWFIGLLVLVGVQLIFGMAQDGEAIVRVSHESGPSHDRSLADAGPSADLVDETQEQEDNVAGPGDGDSRTLRYPAGLRMYQPLMQAQLQLMPGPFRPPRLF
ncbi:hypothetical protein [Nitrospira sp. Nam80]